MRSQSQRQSGDHARTVPRPVSTHLLQQTSGFRPAEPDHYWQPVHASTARTRVAPPSARPARRPCRCSTSPCATRRLKDCGGCPSLRDCHHPFLLFDVDIIATTATVFGWTPRMTPPRWFWHGDSDASVHVSVCQHSVHPQRLQRQPIVNGLLCKRGGNGDLFITPPSLAGPGQWRRWRRGR